MNISSEQLDHLAMLCSLKLTDDDKQKLLPHLEKILGLVSQLEGCDVTEIEGLSHPQHDQPLKLQEGVQPSEDTDKLLENVQHPIKNNSIGLIAPN